MTQSKTTNEPGWNIGLTQDSRTNSIGICVRRRFNRQGETFEWSATASAGEIAAQLRNAALYLEAMQNDE